MRYAFVGGIGQRGLNLLRKCRGDSFVGIKRQDPVVRGEEAAKFFCAT
jgi:hypothetical protein